MESKEAMIVEYIKTLTPPLEREAIFKHFREVDSMITRGTISRALREAGYVAKRMRGGDTPSGVCQRWVKKEQEPEKTEDTSGGSVEIRRVTETNASLDEERMQLVELVQKSVKLRKEVKEQQKQLLMEMAQLIQEMYSASDD